MDDDRVLFSYDINQLYQNNEERCFEQVKAEKYKLLEPFSSMYWIFGEETCPEMCMAIRKAKNEFNHLWPSALSDLNVAELIFQIVELQFSNKILREENAMLHKQIHGGIPFPPIQTSSDQLMTSMNEVSMSLVCDETMIPTNCFKPVPGVNTILACGEKSRIDKDQSTALTAKVCQGIDQIAQMFYDRDSFRQDNDNETLNIGDQSMGESDPNHFPPPKTSVPLHPSKNENSPRKPSGLQIWKNEPSAPLNIHKDLPPSEIPLGYRPGGLKVYKDEPEKPLGLQIFKDPEGVAGRSEFQRPLPTRTGFGGDQRFSPPKPRHQQQIGDENLAPRCLLDNFSQLDITGSRIDLVPCCASTAVFQVPKRAVLPSPITPITESKVWTQPKKSASLQPAPQDLLPCCASTAVFQVPKPALLPTPITPISVGGTNPISSPTIEPKVETQPKKFAPLQPAAQEFKPQNDDNDMDVGNSGDGTPIRPVPLSEEFNQFVHSPDERGKFRVDATKFIEVFLTKKNKNPVPSSGTNERKWPPHF